MPFRRFKRSYGRRRFKRRSYGSKGFNLSSAWKTAKWAAQQAWKLKGLVNSEMFKYDVNQSGTAITSAGYASNLAGVAVGDTDVTRTGNSIFARS